jgi:hypothetical protein
MLKCVLGKCPNDVIGGFKHEMHADHSGLRNVEVEAGWSATYWCKEHENDLRNELRGPGRYFTDEEVKALKEAR